jgi:ABC-type spermidine/putrescine transport system permease subunit II
MTMMPEKNPGEKSIIKSAIFYSFCVFVLIFMIMPNFVVFPISFSSATYLEFPPKQLSLRWYHDYFARPEWVGATIRSFQVAIVVTFVSVILGSLAAYGLVRGRFPGKSFLNSLIISPMVAPILVTAVAMFIFFAKLGVNGTFAGFIIAHTVVATPFVVIVMSASLRGLDIELEQAAMNLGANRFTTLRRVVFPMVIPGMISSGLFAFLISFDELIIAIFISTPTMDTLPKRLWEGIRTEINPTIASISVMLILISIFVLVSVGFVRRYFERRNQ